MDKFLKQLAAFLRALTPGQKMLLGGSAVAVIATLALFVRLSQKAEMRVLFSGLAPADAQMVEQRLAVQGISYDVSTDGTAISVPESALNKTRLNFAMQGMPETGRFGFELFDKPNWAGSDFSEQVNYQRALEGELERTIETLGDVESVRVHLVLPHDSLFTDRERVAKAAVVLKVRGGGLSPDEINAVTHLVAGAVDNLSPENVTLIGADGRTPLVAKGRDGMNGMQPSEDMETGLAEKVVATLAPVVGADHVKASVTVAYDPTSGDTTQETYDPSNPVLVSTQIQEEHFAGSPPEGIPGTPSNVPAAPAGNGKPPAVANAKTSPQKEAKEPPATAQSNPLNPIIAVNSEGEDQHSETRQYLVSKTLKHTIDPVGRIQRMAAAVLVDDVIEQQKDTKGQMVEVRRKRTPQEMQQIEDLTKAALGFDATRGDVISVQNVAFQEPPQTPAGPLTRVERVRQFADKWMWAIRYLFLLVLFVLAYFLILQPILAPIRKLFEQKVPGELPADARPQLAGAAAGGEGSVTLPGQAGSALSSEEMEMQLGEASSELQRVIKLKKHLTEKVKSDPEQASLLVRHWMREGGNRS
ncbi:MAG TPA: flagellar basal-body MS-ring/collar protein FliF [Candidatus Aquilonibacter sp.]|nr:flagellar basal-body MS-ring/collar protein FliF [Candidatus Aquilonibacter sp.]